MEKEKENKQKVSKVAFWVCLIVSIGLMVGGALVPPPFVVDASIFKCVGWLFGFAALGLLPDVLALGRTAKIQRGNTVVTIGKDNNHNGFDDDFEAEHSIDDDWQRRQDIDNADALDD